MSEKMLFNNLIMEEWLSHTEASQYLKVSEGSLRNMTSRGEVIYSKLGGRNRYELSELRKLLLSNKQGGYKWELKD